MKKVKNLYEYFPDYTNKEAITSFNKIIYDYFPKFSEDKLMREGILTFEENFRNIKE